MQATSLRRIAASFLRRSTDAPAAGSVVTQAAVEGSSRKQEKQKALDTSEAAVEQSTASTSPASSSSSVSSSYSSSSSHLPSRTTRQSRSSTPFEDPATYLRTVPVIPGKPFNLAAFHPILDVHPGLYTEVPGNKRHAGVTLVDIQTPAALTPNAETLARIRANSANGGGGGGADADALAALAADASNSFTVQQLRGMHRYPLVVHRVVNMTSKGKIASMYALVVVGNGKGLVGYGEGKAENVTAAVDKAFVQAVKNLDFVQRKDDRTTWSDLMTGKWGSTTVELRSRPPGFGLRTSPIIHQIARAAGILDLSAKIRGSRNGMNTVKATINLLHGGAAPAGLGDLSGKEKLARRFKGRGMRTTTEIGLDLGRKPIELR